ncbi:MAG TPA: hypothetical protein DCM54_01745 [Gammaproteobacteria bacterium]|nr:hypothetical protein [Gammaproteobacteria bacterium]|tara:strand:+ start:2683 stop:3285 length:603 start_codon:yes stop_codon:yes gene_type:complete
MNDRTKWDRIYSEKTKPLSNPAEVLVHNTHLIGETGRALDLACVLGQNSLWLAQRGFVVDSWDISQVALDNLKRAGTQDLSIHTKQVDISAASLECEAYDLIIVIHYLNRNLADAIVESLRPGGLLCYQTFTVEKTKAMGPGNPKFLLQPNELLSIFATLRVLSFKDEGQARDCSAGLRGESYLIAQKKFSEVGDTLQAC